MLSRYTGTFMFYSVGEERKTLLVSSLEAHRSAEWTIGTL